MKRIFLIVLVLLMGLILFSGFRSFQGKQEQAAPAALGSADASSNEINNAALGTEAGTADEAEPYVQQVEFNEAVPDVPDENEVEEYVVEIRDDQVFTMN